MSDFGPINKSYQVLEEGSNSFAQPLFRWFNNLWTNVRDSLKKGSQGVYVVDGITSTEASALTATEGMFIFVTDTNGTFTSIGFWGYENGSWNKL